MVISEITKKIDGIDYHLTVETETNKVLKVRYNPEKVHTGNARVDALTVTIEVVPMTKLEEERFVRLLYENL